MENVQLYFSISKENYLLICKVIKTFMRNNTKTIYKTKNYCVIIVNRPKEVDK